LKEEKNKLIKDSDREFTKKSAEPVSASTPRSNLSFQARPSYPRRNTTQQEKSSIVNTPTMSRIGSFKSVKKNSEDDLEK